MRNTRQPKIRTSGVDTLSIEICSGLGHGYAIQPTLLNCIIKGILGNAFQGFSEVPVGTNAHIRMPIY